MLIASRIKITLNIQHTPNNATPTELSMEGIPAERPKRPANKTRIRNTKATAMDKMCPRKGMSARLLRRSIQHPTISSSRLTKEIPNRKRGRTSDSNCIKENSFLILGIKQYNHPRCRAARCRFPFRTHPGRMLRMRPPDRGAGTDSR